MNDNWNKVKNILIKNNLPLSGVCGFSALSDKLLLCRAASRLPEKSESVIFVLFPYYLGEEAYNGANISRYACVPDYHGVAEEILGRTCDELRAEFPDEKFEFFADNSPIPEVYGACLAGLGKRGENGLLIHNDYGSWVFIGEIVTTLHLPATGDGEVHPCLQCGACVKKCPAKAIEQGGINAEKCLSAVTQKKKELNEEEKRLIIASRCAWGCDVCQNVCPMNKNAEKTYLTEFLNNYDVKAEIGGSLENRAYAWRGRKVFERNLKLLNDNYCKF